MHSTVAKIYVVSLLFVKLLFVELIRQLTVTMAVITVV